MLLGLFELTPFLCLLQQRQTWLLLLRFLLLLRLRLVLLLHRHTLFTGLFLSLVHVAVVPGTRPW